MKRKWFEIQNRGERAEIHIYDYIGEGGNSAKDFIKEFKAIKSEQVDIYINSPGGSVFDGIAIYSTIVNSEKNVTTHIDGIAASTAGFIAMAGDTVKMAKNAQLMIHRVSNIVWGDSEQMKKEAKVMEGLENQIIDIYINKTGLDESEIRAMMDEETWLDSKTAKEKGFVDEITGKKEISNAFDISNYDYKHIPQTIQKPNKEEETIMPKTLDELTNQVNTLSSENADLKTQIKNLKADMSAKDAAMQAKDSELQNLQTKVADFEKKEIDDAVNAAIQNGKLLPAQKEWAVNLATAYRKSFDTYLDSVKNLNLEKMVFLPDAQDENADPANPENLTFDDLNKDAGLYEKIKNEQPELFEKLRNEWLKK